MKQHDPIEQILEHVELDADFPVSELWLDEKLGFLALGQHMIIGFGSPAPADVERAPDIRVPTLKDDEQGSARFMDSPKGLGLRIGNSPAAMIQPRRRGLQPSISAIEIYMPRDARETIHDARRQPGIISHIGGYATHLSLLVRSKVQGSQSALARVESPYGDSPLVQLGLPPSWIDEHRRRGIRYPISPTMLLVRSPLLLPTEAGSVDLEALQASFTSRG